MKYYTYFPGCSSESTAIGMSLSLDAIAEPLEMKLAELEGWTCCGSTPYGSLDEMESLVIAARNLALAEKTGLDMVTPCSSCYVTLNKANHHLNEHPQLLAQVNEALAVAKLEYKGTVKVRHIVEVLFNDIKPENIAAKVKRQLTGLKVAAYSGCQLVRPDYGFDSTEFPDKFDKLVTALGAEAVNFPLKSRCCGSSLSISETDKVLGLMEKLFANAAENGAVCFTTPCPLCQTNLDAYQSLVNGKFSTHYNLPVFFISQLIGVALGLDEKSLGLDRNIVSPQQVLRQGSEVKSGT
ncbi:MAG: CoB--CoM heterodisulfide reductase iron-sulfur subunit B family protein [Dehalococcoidales bacterium]|nr:CoB--CoM heterodisulfide reductase iron-sulfur subunit B family protein [Dehalococcoidales bacterium]